ERARTVIRAPRSIRPAPRLQGAADREATAAPFPLRAPTGGVLTAAAADALAATRSLVASLLDVLRGASAARSSCGPSASASATSPCSSPPGRSPTGPGSGRLRRARREAPAPDISRL